MLAFVVKTTPAALKQVFVKGSGIDLSETIISHQKLTVASTTNDLSELIFSPQESDEIKHYLSAKAGNNLNLSATEIKQFQSISATVKKTNEAQKAVEEQLHKILLNRFQAYSKNGVKAITPYQRENEKQFSLGGYFQEITQVAPIVQQYYPSFYQALNDYPLKKPASLEESFFALKLEVESRPTFALMHRLLVQEGDAFAVAIRQYYVTQSYNGTQDLGVFIPIEQGVLVLGVFRTSSDAVAGFGSSVKHSIGRRLLASSLIKFLKKFSNGTKNRALEQS